MANFNIKKYGWIADPENNFSDDGSYFYAYKFEKDPRFTATKCSDSTDIYFDVKFHSDKTSFYKYFGKLNGVRKEFAIDHLQELMDEIDEFIKDLDTIDVIQTIPENVKNIIINGCKNITSDKVYSFVANMFDCYKLDKNKMNYPDYAAFYRQCVDASTVTEKNWCWLYRQMSKYLMSKIVSYDATKANMIEEMNNYNLPRDYPASVKKEVKDKCIADFTSIIDSYFKEEA